MKLLVFIMLYGAVVVLIPFYSGAFGVEYRSTELGLRLSNSAMAFPVFTLYLFFANRYLERQARFLLGSFLVRGAKGLNSPSTNPISPARYRLHLKLSVCGGILITGIYVTKEELISTHIELFLVYLHIAAVIFWTFACLTILRLFYSTVFIVKHFLNNQYVDLFSVNKMKPITDLVLSNIVVSTIMIALIPIFWIGRPIPDIDIVIVSIVFVLVSLYLIWPLLAIQKIISRKKRLAIARINDSFIALFDSKNGMQRRLTDDTLRLRELSALICAKREILNAAEWPIDLPQGIKGTLIVASIPISWIIGSLIETLISKLDII